MKYPKDLMSITELVDMGYSRDMLMNYSKARNAPVVWTMGGGKVYFKTAELDAFIEEVNARVEKKKEEQRKRRAKRYRRTA